MEDTELKCPVCKNLLILMKGDHGYNSFLRCGMCQYIYGGFSSKEILLSSFKSKHK